MDVLSSARAFVAVARHRSFTRAAQAEGMGQPVISRRVAALEHELGGDLIDRRTRHAHLTDLGAAVLSHAQALLDAEARLIAQAQDHRDRHIRLLMPPDYPTAAWAELQLALRAAGQVVRFEPAPLAQRALALAAGEVDGAVLPAEGRMEDWVVPLGIGAAGDDPAELHLLRPTRGAAEGPSILLLEEDAGGGMLPRLQQEAVFSGLAPCQVESVPSLIEALERVIAGDARLLCTESEATFWGLRWHSQPNASLERRWRLECSSPGLEVDLRKSLKDRIGKFIGVERQL
ncbi:LysR family transcriptional regulator [Micrococcus luteus]|uniref:LysR family transcriptional regulator n=1 Tax=Micrococcus luteus TaxID=1270 RepID=UPI0009B99295|nr:LysR family transcriptional regulator [Micrococcus luteus]